MISVVSEMNLGDRRTEYNLRNLHGTEFTLKLQ